MDLEILYQETVRTLGYNLEILKKENKEVDYEGLFLYSFSDRDKDKKRVENNLINTILESANITIDSINEKVGEFKNRLNNNYKYKDRDEYFFYVSLLINGSINSLYKGLSNELLLNKVLNNKNMKEKFIESLLMYLAIGKYENDLLIAKTNVVLYEDEGSVNLIQQLMNEGLLKISFKNLGNKEYDWFVNNLNLNHNEETIKYFINSNIKACINSKDIDFLKKYRNPIKECFLKNLKSILKDKNIISDEFQEIIFDHECIDYILNNSDGIFNRNSEFNYLRVILTSQIRDSSLNYNLLIGKIITKLKESNDYQFYISAVSILPEYKNVKYIKNNISKIVDGYYDLNKVSKLLKDEYVNFHEIDVSIPNTIKGYRVILKLRETLKISNEEIRIRQQRLIVEDGRNDILINLINKIELDDELKYGYNDYLSLMKDISYKNNFIENEVSISIEELSSIYNKNIEKILNDLINFKAKDINIISYANKISPELCIKALELNKNNYGISKSEGLAFKNIRKDKDKDKLLNKIVFERVLLSKTKENKKFFLKWLNDPELELNYIIDNESYELLDLIKYNNLYDGCILNEINNERFEKILKEEVFINSFYKDFILKNKEVKLTDDRRNKLLFNVIKYFIQDYRRKDRELIKDNVVNFAISNADKDEALDILIKLNEDVYKYKSLFRYSMKESYANKILKQIRRNSSINNLSEFIKLNSQYIGLNVIDGKDILEKMDLCIELDKECNTINKEFWHKFIIDVDNNAFLINSYHESLFTENIREVAIKKIIENYDKSKVVDVCLQAGVDPNIKNELFNISFDINNIESLYAIINRNDGITMAMFENENISLILNKLECEFNADLIDALKYYADKYIKSKSIDSLKLVNLFYNNKMAEKALKDIEVLEIKELTKNINVSIYNKNKENKKRKL